MWAPSCSPWERPRNHLVLLPPCTSAKGRKRPHVEPSTAQLRGRCSEHMSGDEAPDVLDPHPHDRCAHDLVVQRELRRDGVGVAVRGGELDVVVLVVLGLRTLSLLLDARKAQGTAEVVARSARLRRRSRLQRLRRRVQVVAARQPQDLGALLVRECLLRRGWLRRPPNVEEGTRQQGFEDREACGHQQPHGDARLAAAESGGACSH
mmetsp:Transcript_87921/g.282218  ORF Transcript_87921/g.282218 Transcript_87921/m.282218 type:complete len:207 (-) Transcript_87921:75-695(-)